MVVTVSTFVVLTATWLPGVVSTATAHPTTNIVMTLLVVGWGWVRFGWVGVQEVGRAGICLVMISDDGAEPMGSEPMGSEPMGSESAGYALPWYRDLDRDAVEGVNGWGWTAQDYTLAYALGVDTNLEAEQLVVEELTATANPLRDRIGFDSERGCFFAYAASEADMVALVAVVARMVAQRFPKAIPGTIVDSPAYLRRFADLDGGRADV